MKNYTALAKLDTAAYKTFEKMCYWEFIERWDDPDFQEEKAVFDAAIKRKRKEKAEKEKEWNLNFKN